MGQREVRFFTTSGKYDELKMDGKGIFFVPDTTHLPFWKSTKYLWTSFPRDCTPLLYSKIMPNLLTINKYNKFINNLYSQTDQSVIFLSLLVCFIIVRRCQLAGYILLNSVNYGKQSHMSDVTFCHVFLITRMIN